MKSEKEIKNTLILWKKIVNDENNTQEQLWLMRTVVNCLEWVLN